jgi:hypothetical protein
MLMWKDCENGAGCVFGAPAGFDFSRQDTSQNSHSKGFASFLRTN